MFPALGRIAYIRDEEVNYFLSVHVCDTPTPGVHVTMSMMLERVRMALAGPMREQWWCERVTELGTGLVTLGVVFGWVRWGVGEDGGGDGGEEGMCGRGVDVSTL